MQAIRTWLGSYLHAGKTATFDAYWVFRTNVTAGFGIVTEDFGPS
jgi:hypothetical protein